MARKFFYVCAGMLMLALSYHLGASTATAQAGGSVVVAATAGNYVFTANGDVYRPVTWFPDPSQWAWAGNVFGSGGPTPALHESWGQVKARYRGNPVSTVPGTTDR